MGPEYVSMTTWLLRACVSLLLAVVALWLAVEVIRAIWICIAVIAAVVVGVALLVAWLRRERSPW